MLSPPLRLMERKESFPRLLPRGLNALGIPGQSTERQSRAGRVLGGGLNRNVMSPNFSQALADDAMRQFRSVAISAEMAQIQMPKIR